MKKIDRYITKNFIKAILLSILAFMIIVVISQLNRAVGFVLDGKMEPKIATAWLFSEVPAMTVTLAPLAVLLGGLMTINKMSKNLEVIALKTSGISFRRIIKYPLIVSLLFCGLIGLFNDRVAIKGNKLKTEIKFKYLYNLSAPKIGTQVYRKGLGDYLYYIRIVNGEENTLNNLTAVLMNEELTEINDIVSVQRARFLSEEEGWLGENVWVNDIKEGNETFHTKLKLEFFTELPSDLLKDKFVEDEATIGQLRDAAIYLQRAGGDVRKLLVAFHTRIAYPFSIFIMAIIGLSLGSRYVRGASAISIVVSIILGYSYFVIQSLLQAASIGGLSPIVGAWLPNTIYLAGGLYTLYRAEF